MAQITCKNLSLGYEGKTIVSDLNFIVEKGNYLCIVGENGSGKTTLMKTILKLQPAFGGSVITGDGLRQEEIGYLPQQTAAQRDFPATVKEIVFSGCQSCCRFRPFYKKSEKETAWKNMKKMGVLELKDRCYRELSGGQQQRVLLARALCAAGSLLFLDEPVSGLDPLAAAEMYHLIADLNQKDGITVIMITHDAAAFIYASHILRIGETCFFGTRQEYVTAQKDRKVLPASERSSL